MAALLTGALVDDTIALRRDPYRFISRRCAEIGQDAFETRLLLRRTWCMSGADAARVFYDPTRFQRAGAAPPALQKTLFGTGGVQGLDGARHAHRKAMFLHLNDRERVNSLAGIVRGHWRTALHEWVGAGTVELYPRVQEVLTRAVCEWAGMPLGEEEVTTRTRELSALFDEAGSVGPGHLRARRERRRADRWAEDVIRSIRAGSRSAPEESPVRVIAAHREPEGNLLDPRVAAVELLNVLRPTVATAVYVTFLAHALEAHPVWRQRLAEGDGSEDGAFVEEVRRLYPFFPAVVAVVRESFEWQGHRFDAGQRALLDIYGTNRDSRQWERAGTFDPERFMGPAPDPFAFIPQGGGDPAVHHRCPGEPISTRLMAVALDELTRGMTYVPARPDSPVLLDRLPALPAHGYVIKDVRVSQR